MFMVKTRITWRHVGTTASIWSHCKCHWLQNVHFWVCKLVMISGQYPQRRYKSSVFKWHVGIRLRRQYVGIYWHCHAASITTIWTYDESNRIEAFDVWWCKPSSPQGWWFWVCQLMNGSQPIHFIEKRKLCSTMTCGCLILMNGHGNKFSTM